MSQPADRHDRYPVSQCFGSLPEALPPLACFHMGCFAAFGEEDGSVFLFQCGAPKAHLRLLVFVFSSDAAVIINSR